jgi:predicted nucleotide-binding protein (sugar kinase/HSP70/actin superfamily)
VLVPPNPGAMGAWGIGLCAIEQLGAATLTAAAPFELASFLEATISERGELRCQEKACATLCNIERTMVSVLGTKRQVFSGGACPKFEISTAARPKLDAQAPSAFDERNALLSKLDAPGSGALQVGVPEAGTLSGYLPWATTFLTELGLGVTVLRSDAASLERGEELSYAYDACAPVKVAHALAYAGGELLFMPKVIDLPAADGGGPKTCANEQAIPDVVAAALHARGKRATIVAPVVSLGSGYTHKRVLRELRQAARQLGADPDRVAAAAERAGQVQVAYQKQLEDIGKRTLDYGRLTRTPVVVVCGSLHVLYDRSINAGMGNILRQNGVLALPMDCYPVPEHIDRLPRVPWTDLNHALRVSLAARERGDTYPLLLTAFGCGPASFGEQIFETLMSDYPHTALETDGHGGNAGYVTRVQAFLHGVRKYDRRPSPLPAQRLAFLAPAPKPCEADKRDSRLLVFPIGDRLGALAAATYRSMGYDAAVAGPASNSALAHGRRDCSGKECLPYQLIWGAFREQLSEQPPKKRTLLVQVAGQGACRNCMFSIKDRMSLEHMGLQDRVELRHFGALSEGQGLFFGKFWASTVAWDILNQLVAYHRPAARDPLAVDALYTRYCDALEALAGQPGATGIAGLLRLGEGRNPFQVLLRSASADFAALARADRALPTVLLTGDIYVRVDEYANDHLVRRLNDRGLRVLLDPVSMLVEYLVEERSAELLGLPTEYLPNKVTAVVMQRTRRQLYDCVRKEHPFLLMPDIPGALRAGAPVLGRFPQSEAPITVGTFMQAVEQKLCDGVVVVSPWGCSPALITESLLRHQHALPTLFVYSDGTPLDERKLNGFAYRMRTSGAPASAHA